MARRKPDPVATEAGDMPEAGRGEAVMKAPKGATSVTFDGEEFTVENGYIVVPTKACAELESFGYRVPDEGGAVPDGEE